MKKLILCSCFFLVSYSIHAQTSSSPVISYQGLIQGVDGLPVKDSTYPITIILWTDTDGGSPIWQDIFQANVSGGVFNILLGSQNPLPSSSEMDHQLWISVSVSNFSEASQRSRLSAVPMAINVADSAITTLKLADSSVTTSKIADNAITWNKMGTEYIPYFRVNGAKVTTGHNSINFTGSKEFL